MISELATRWHLELAYWRLRLWQFVGLVLLSVWPWLIGTVLPGDHWLVIGPVIVFMPLAYMGGSALHALVPNMDVAFQIGASITIFLVAYLVVVSWRQSHRGRK